MKFKKRLSLKRSRATGKRQTLTLIISNVYMNKRMRKILQKIGLIKKFSLLRFIKKKFTSSQVGPVRKLIMRESRKPAIVGFVLILVVVSAYFLFFASSEVLAEWWDTNWHYRKAITITNSGSTQTDFQVKVLSNYDMSADVTNGKVQADFDDLRFTDINGNALDYWIEDNTAASLDVWVKIDSIPAGTPIVYMYYGNPSASATSNVAYIIGNSTNPGISCTDIKNNRDASDGIYYIDPDGGSSGNKFQAYCDMTIENGGWTEILNLDTNDGVDHWWGDTTFWQSTGTEGSAATSLTSGYKSQAFTDMSSFAEMMIFMHTEGVQVAYGVYDVLGGYQSSSFYNLFSIVNSDAGTTITSTLQHQSGASNVPLNTQRSQTRYGDEFIDIFNTEAIVVNRVKRFNTDGINYMRLATTFDNTSYVHTMSGLGVHHERPTGSYICKVEAAPVTAYCGLVPRYGSDATATGCFCGTVTSYDRDMAIFVRDSTPDAINMSFVTSGLEEKGPGPVGYWSFDEGYGSTAQDRTSNNNDGTITGATWQAEDLCKSGKCLSFDGNGDWITLTSEPFTSSDADYTISLWARWNTVPTGGHMRYISWGGTSGRYFFGYNYSSQKIDVGHGGITVTPSDASYKPTANVWEYWTVTNSGTTTKFYKDGVLINTESHASTGTISAGDPVRIGRQFLTNTEYFNGFIDDVKIYPYARTADQIKADYNAGKARASSSAGVSASLSSDKLSMINISDGLVGYWKMDEASGNAVDSSGNGNTGTWNGTGSHYPAGKFGNGGGFNGSSDYVRLPMLISDDFSVSLWFSSTDVGSGGTDYRWYRGDGLFDSEVSGVVNDFGIAHHSDGYIIAGVGNPDTHVQSSSGYNDGNWHNVIFTRDKTTGEIDLYLDGNLVDSDIGNTNSLTSATYTDIGRIQAGINYFNGSIDEVRVYNRALSAREVKALYEYAPGPVAYYDFEESSGTTLYDKSGHGYNSSSFIGSPTWSSGKYGGALYLDGTNDYINLPISIWAKTPDKVTMSVWVKGSNQNTSTSLIYANPSQKINVHAPWSGTTMYWDYGNACCTGRISKAMPSEWINDNWTHFTFVSNLETSSMKIYANGLLWHSGSTTQDMTVAPTSFTLGSGAVGADKWRGYIDEFKIYDYERTQKQILEDMNAGRPAQKSPVGWWKFDEGYGTSTSDSGLGNNDGTITGATWTNAGKLGKALSFDGGDVIDTSLSLSVANDFTLSAWIKKTTSATLSTIIGSWNPWIWYVNNQEVRFETWINSIESHVSAETNVGYNEWTHLAVRYIYSEDKIKFYNNGIPDGELVLVGKLGSPNETIHIGGYPHWKFVGIIDEAKVYNYALTDEEIKQEYNQGKVSVMGAVGGDGSGSSSSAGIAEYCVPGSSDSCDPPVAEWNFEEHAGTSAYDSSGNGNIGTLTNMEDSDWTVGKIGGGLDFDGDNEYITIPDSSGQRAMVLTVEVWVKSLENSASLQQGIIAKANLNGSELGWILRKGVDNKFYFSTGPSYIRQDANTYSNIAYTDNNWHHIVGQRLANGTNYIYIDGIKQIASRTGSVINVDANPQPIVIGTSYGDYPLHTGYNERFEGYIDQIRIYDYARTPAQVAWDYNKGKPIAHYKMDKGEGTTAYDSSGNGNNGTITPGTLGQTSAGSVKVNANTAWYNGRSGKQNYSLNFDGSDDYVSVPDPSSGILDFGASQDFTIASWVKTTSNVAWDRLMGKTSTPRSETTWYSVAISSGKARLELGGPYPSNYITVDSISSVNDNNWHHIVFIRDKTGANNIKAYIDGKLERTSGTDPTGDLSNSAPLNLMRDQDGVSNRFLEGQIDDVRIYNYALTADQIKTEYNMGAARLGTGN